MKELLRYMVSIDKNKIRDECFDMCVPRENIFNEITLCELSHYIKVSTQLSFGGLKENSCDVFEYCISEYASYVDAIDLDTDGVANTDIATVIGFVGAEVYSKAITDLGDLNLNSMSTEVVCSRYIGEAYEKLQFVLDINYTKKELNNNGIF